MIWPDSESNLTERPFFVSFSTLCSYFRSLLFRDWIDWEEQQYKNQITGLKMAVNLVFQADAPVRLIESEKNERRFNLAINCLFGNHLRVDCCGQFEVRTKRNDENGVMRPNIISPFRFEFCSFGISAHRRCVCVCSSFELHSFFNFLFSFWVHPFIGSFSHSFIYSNHQSFGTTKKSIQKFSQKCIDLIERYEWNKTHGAEMYIH